jgi:benzoate-CoA ligase family protein
MTDDPQKLSNLADYFLDARVREGRGRRPAIHAPDRTYTYAEVQRIANELAHALAKHGVEPEHRVLIALPDGVGFVSALFGVLKLGAVVVMVNPGLRDEDVAELIEYTRARAVVTSPGTASMFVQRIEGSFARAVHVLDDRILDEALRASRPAPPTFPSHPDDAAIWLFSGGTTGRPKAVIQTHGSFINTTERYAKDVIGYSGNDVTLSVPKLYFGYATGSNLLFPFSVGAATVLFPEPATAEVLFGYIRRFRPTILVNVPTMVNRMMSHPEAAEQDLSSLRLSTSAGEALPVELHERWARTFGVELLDGLGTAEMWHIFLTNMPGRVRPGTLGTVVPGFEIKVCDEEGAPLPAGETGWLWVRGGSRAIAYWQHQEKTEQTFRGEWVVTGDMVSMDAEGFVTYCGRGDELLKVAGKWLSPQEVEGCLLQHDSVAEVAVVGQADASGLVKPLAFVVARGATPGLEEELKAFVRERLAPYKHPREVFLVEALPRTHLGKVDRGRLRRPS